MLTNEKTLAILTIEKFYIKGDFAMLKIPNKLSIFLSVALSVLFFVVCIVLCFIMPQLVDLFIEAHDNIGSQVQLSANGRENILALAYTILVDIFVADILLFALLLRVRRELVFTSASVALVRGVSWCCVLLGLFFGLLGLYFRIAFVVAFAALFLGLCLRVVKNVIEQANEIKSENDLTV